MLYEVSCSLRFKNKGLRDNALKAIIDEAKKAEGVVDSHVSTHLCYHDEPESQPCELEEHLDMTDILQP